MSSHNKKSEAYLVKREAQKKVRRTSHFIFFDSRFTIHSSRGFTLIEVLVAITILAVGLVLVVEAMGRTQQALRVSQNLIMAAQIAEEHMAEIELEVREFKRLRAGEKNGTEKFSGKVFEWRSKSMPLSHSTLKDKTRLNEVFSETAWKEGSRASRLKIQSLILNRGQKK